MLSGRSQRTAGVLSWLEDLNSTILNRTIHVRRAAQFSKPMVHVCHIMSAKRSQM